MPRNTVREANIITYAHYNQKFGHSLQPEQVIKVSLKTNKSFNFTMKASFLPVIVSKKHKQTKKNMLIITVSHKFTYILKKNTRKKQK